MDIYPPFFHNQIEIQLLLINHFGKSLTLLTFFRLGNFVKCDCPGISGANKIRAPYFLDYISFYLHYCFASCCSLLLTTCDHLWIGIASCVDMFDGCCWPLTNIQHPTIAKQFLQPSWNLHHIEAHTIMNHHSYHETMSWKSNMNHHYDHNKPLYPLDFVGLSWVIVIHHCTPRITTSN